MTDTALPLIIRVSSLPMFPNCGRRWAAIALWREIKAAGFELRKETHQGIGSVIGTSLHFAGEITLKEKLIRGAMPAFDMAESAAMERFLEERARGIQYDKSEKRDGLTPNQRTAEIQLRRMTRSYYNYVAPLINPAAVEERIEADVPNMRQPMRLSGKPDVVAAEPDGVVDDLKSGKLGNYNAQAGGYSLLAVTAGTQITKANIDHVPRVSVRREQPKPTRVPLDVALCEQMAMDTLRDIDNDVTRWREGDHQRGMLPGDPRAFRANPHQYLCHEKYCPAHSCGPSGFCLEWRTKE
jgi:hypothetical protein